MKFFSSRRAVEAAEGSSQTVGRRGLVVGAGVAGAAALAAAALHRGVVADPVAVGTKLAPAGDGYQVTPHVLRYYETTRS